MIKTKKNCSVCQTILDQPKKWEGRLAKRIYETRHYRASSDLSLAQLAKEYSDKFSYESLLNHCKKHQFLTEEDFNERHLRQTARQAEKALLKEAITSQKVWDTVIQKGMEDLTEGRMTLSPTHLLGAARDKSNWEVKHADQQLQMMDMVYAFASGEGLPNGVRRDDAIEGEIVTDGTPEGDRSREERSRTFYQSLIGDASTPGTD